MDGYKLKQFLLVTFFSTVLTACGGGGGDTVELVDTPVAETPVAETPVAETPVAETPVAETPVAETPVAETPVAETPVAETPVVETPVVEPPEAAFSLTGKVIDGYIENAIVYLDLNDNNVLDDGEPSVTTDSSGAYELNLTDEQKEFLQSVPVRAILGENAVDIDTGELFAENPVILSGLISQAITGDNATVSISPFSSELVASIDEHLAKYRSGDMSVSEFALEWNAAKASLILTLSQNLAIEPFDAELLLGDFIAELTENSAFSDEEVLLIKQEAILRTDTYQQAYKMQVELQATLEENQKASVAITVYPFSDWNTFQNMILKEVNKTIYTRLENGDEITELDISKTRLNDTGDELLDPSGDPIIYEIYQGAITHFNDGTYIETGYWEKDLNGDNIRKVRGQHYKVGSYDDSGYQVKTYFDETHPNYDFEGNIDSYDAIDLSAAVKSGDLTAVEQVQDQIDTTVIIDGVKVHTYQFNSLQDSGGSIFDQQVYLERRITSIYPSGDYQEEILRDSNGDGVFDSRQLTTLTADGEKTVVNENIVNETDQDVAVEDNSEEGRTEEFDTQTFTLFYKIPTENETLDSESEHLNWGLHIWNTEDCNAFSDEQLQGVAWDEPVEADGFDPEKGVYFELQVVKDNSGCANFIIHKGDDKSTDSVDEAGAGDMILDLALGNTATVIKSSFEITYP